MTLGNCANCKFWAKREAGQAGWKIGLGKCSNVPKFHDVTESSPNPDEYDLGTEVLKPEYQDVKALAIDGSGYRAELLTMGTFGCIAFVSKT